MLPLVEDLSADRLHVQAPTNVVFLCGGAYSPKGKGAIKSLRDAFLRVSMHPSLENCELILAEDFTKQFEFSAHYKDILRFEADLAQLAELIVLFCESQGSFAELGAFAHDEEISRRLLVIIRERYAVENSFITLGPLARLKNQSESAVFAIEDGSVGISKNSYRKVSLDSLKSILDSPLRIRLERTRERSTFNRRSDGHVIKLIVGLIQEYGALNKAEILFALRQMGLSITSIRLGAFLMCAVAVGWIELSTVGFGNFFVPKVSSPAAEFHVLPTAQVKGRGKRINHIREYWAHNDKVRFSAIQKSMKAIFDE